MKKENHFTREEAYDRSISILKKCMTPHGFMAAASKKQRYGRIWSRDGVITGIGAMMTEDGKLTSCFKKTLETLRKYQHKLGFIPSNADPVNGQVSYGGSAGRVDATIWYVIGVGQYFKRTHDKDFLKRHLSSVKKVIRILNYWEFNDKYFLYVPMGGDWADEYINEGYVLYDQLLYLQALREYAYMNEKLNKNPKRDIRRECSILKQMIGINYWLQAKNYNSSKIYNRVIFQKGINEQLHKKHYLLPYFNPGGYGRKFDGFANTLAILLQALSKQKQRIIMNYVKDRFSKRTRYLIPAFWAPIKQDDERWKRLKSNYSAMFRNKPYHYHNGGLWPFINGFYAAALTNLNKTLARKHLDAVNWANYKSKGKSSWGFYEYIDSKDFRPGGMKYQAWSAAGGVMAYQAVVNDRGIFL